jgi:hypothetical protein
MRFRGMAGLLPIVSTVALCAVLASPAAARVSTYKGQFQCDDRGTITPLAGMNVELWERGSPDFLPVEIVGHRVDQDFTDADGRFAMTTEDNNDNYFVRMALRDAHGVHLRDFWGINDWSIDLGLRRNDVPVQDYGGIVFSTPGQSHKCAIWAGVHAVHERYRTEVGTDLPPFGVEIQADAVTGGTPFTPGTSILWPGGYPVGYGGGGDDTITRHEFGHVIRHGFDGDFGHFLGDVVTFGYARNHEQCLFSNGGYAFNEGWAEFWAPDFAPAPDCGRPGDMETEGNVAAALTELMENCAGGRKRPMVETLQRNPGTIHSFAEFRDRLGCPFPKLFPVTVATTTLAPPKPPVSSPALRAAAARGEVLAGSKRIKGLEKSLKVALGKAENPPDCSKAPCKAALKAAVEPAVLRYEINLAKIQRAAAAGSDTVGEQNKLAGQDIAKLVNDDAKQEKGDRKKVIKAALAGVGDILDAARPVFKVDSSRFAKRLHRDLIKDAAFFRKAAKKGSKALPPSLTLQPPSFRLPPKVPEIPPPSPVPPAAINLLTITKLTIDTCPALVASPKAIEVAGKLTPAQAASTVKLTFTSPSSGPAFVVVNTDADGNWKASYAPSPNDTGAWTVDATFGGDGTHTASSAPTCKVSYA